MKYNLLLFGVFESDADNITIKNVLRRDVRVIERDNVIFKIDEMFLLNEGIARVTLMVGGLRNSKVEELIQEAKENDCSLWSVLSSYIGLSITNEVIINDIPFSFEITSYYYGK